MLEELRNGQLLSHLDHREEQPSKTAAFALFSWTVSLCKSLQTPVLIFKALIETLFYRWVLPAWAPHFYSRDECNREEICRHAMGPRSFLLSPFCFDKYTRLLSGNILVDPDGVQERAKDSPHIVLPCHDPCLGLAPWRCTQTRYPAVARDHENGER